MANDEKGELHKTIWKIANDLRGSVDGWDFKQYVLGFLFYRFISENLTNYLNLHQIKAVGGSQDMPIFTLTAKKGAMNQFNVVHNNEDIVASMNLSELEGTWVQITEVIKVGANGTYSVVIKRIKDGKELLSYNNSDLETIRPDNNFIRPKWGIYRSLKKVVDLREEAVRFADFSITEGVMDTKKK